MRTTTDLYKLLEVPSGATQNYVRKAHRKLGRKYLSDANPGDHSSEKLFREVQGAYEVLSDPKKRREYDKRLSTSTRRSSGEPRERPVEEGSCSLRVVWRIAAGLERVQHFE